MNWQLLKNVNPPRGVVLELYATDFNSVLFAERNKDTDEISIGTGFDGGKIRNSYRMSYERFKEKFGSDVYWSLFVKP